MVKVTQTDSNKLVDVQPSIPVGDGAQRVDNDLENLLSMRLRLDEDNNITAIEKKTLDGWKEYPELESFASMWHTVYQPYVQNLLLSIFKPGFLERTLDLNDTSELFYDSWIYKAFNGFNRLMNEGNLNPQGRELQRLVEGKNFIDLGCGAYKDSFAGRLVAEFFKARKYIGIDINNIKNSFLSKDPFQNNGDFKAYYFKDDLVSFIHNINRQSQDGKVFLISGIEGDSLFSKSAAGIVLEQIAARTQVGDVLLIETLGSTSFNFDNNIMENLRFQQNLWLPTSEGAYNGFKVFVRT
jgi:hypothetical protein